MSPKSFAAPNLTPMDFPSLSPQGHQKEDNMFFSSSVSQPGSIDYASAVKKLASQDSGMWKYERADSSSIGSSRNSHAFPGAAYKSGSIYSDKLQNRPAPVWLETGDAVGKFSLSVLLYRKSGSQILVTSREYVFWVSRGSTRLCTSKECIL